MSDTAIKLFGKRILLTVNHHVLANHSFSADDDDVCCDHKLTSTTTTSLHQHTSSSNKGEDQEDDKEPSSEKESEDKQEDGTSQQIIEDSKDSTTSSGVSDNPKTPSVDREASSLKSSKNGEQSDTSVSQEEKTLKKPDKIIPCPRCNSMDTKFCYYNNYNVNQPRHFCKNCQRYWTAGGTMRNVPVGAGRRKNKSSSASHYRHIMVSEALRTAQVNAANGVHNPSLGKNGTVLTFGSDSPLCESVASVLNLSEKSQNCVLNGFHRPEQRILVGCGGADNGDDHSSGSSITASNSSEKGGGNACLQEAMVKNYQGFPPQVPCFPGIPWPYPWNSAQWNSAMPPPAFCPSGFPVSFYPAPPYWGCTVPAPWNVPCLSPTSSSLNHCAQSSSPTSLTLGKHSRDGNILSPANIEKEEPLKENNNADQSVLVPTTLRIDDPSEAAKSSIWATLGSKSNKTSSFNGGGLFKGFQSKGGDKNYVAETSPLLQANPAALSRSLNFHEST